VNAAAAQDAPREPTATYQAWVDTHTDRLADAAREGTRLATLRGAVFIGILAFLVVADVLTGAGSVAGLLGATVFAALFLVLVVRHRRARARVRRHEVLRSLAVEGLLRLARDWDGLESILPLAETREVPGMQEHPYAADLHVDGHASLARLAGPVTSESGRRMLRRWFLEGAEPTTVELRREAAAELAPELEFRMELACRGRLAGSVDPEGLDALIAWAGRPAVFLADAPTRAAGWALPILTVTLGVLQFIGVLPALWLVPLVGHFLLLRRVARRLDGDLSHLARGAPALRSWGPKLRLVESARWNAAFLRDVASRLDVSGEAAHRRLERLGRLVDVVESRRNLFYHPVNALLLLDIHLGVALDRWRADSGDHVEAWLEALGDTEAVSALACLAHDHPDWTFPEVLETSEQTGAVLHARGLGHPLLEPRACVRNDVEIGPPGTFLLITGSNMSGKSTLLRAIGANVVLAGAGGPACAEALELPRVRLHTSMTVVDSLEDGVSRFMAELLRVRLIVGAAREAPDGAPPVLYLLDELLQGTNTAERRVAAQAILRHLLDAGAIGALTTHDLTLHEAADLASRVRAWHFRESVEASGGKTRLDFDYRLRSGLATTRNALKLLEAVGLGPDRSTETAIE